jgi:two-component system chemotaxis response regulator CheB
LSQEDRVHHSRPAIDYLFASAADVFGKNLLAILLTGANQDGARGLAHVKQSGGTTVVQDPAEARIAVMPLAALALHTPDHILTLGQIGSLLALLESSPC